MSKVSSSSGESESIMDVSDFQILIKNKGPPFKVYEDSVTPKDNKENNTNDEEGEESQFLSGIKDLFQSTLLSDISSIGASDVGNVDNVLNRSQELESNGNSNYESAQEDGNRSKNSIIEVENSNSNNDNVDNANVEDVKKDDR
ncbi:hypothetical protein KGF54_005498 [Candida jiufengensis]|uniref:uncharacterized protein n=1 Tax=Candida jiufengensis TaxID=497108 RepID=UPI00222445E6|nr:uncharacterized protein KGF54_005498 [Candida jiufengensis]KAI5949620.1 hypothetical protein KGF54_005498 [Candida jiufengensis]